MGLLNVFKKPSQNNVKEYSYITAKHFKGFHKFAMAVHGDKEAETNQKKFKDRPSIGVPIVFRDEKPNVISVWLDGIKIGSIINPNEIKQIRDGDITAVYVKFEGEGSDFRAHLIVKEKEEQ